MPPVMVGLLAAVAAAMPALVPFAHGLLILVIILEAAVAAGLVAICTAPPQSPAASTTLPASQKKLGLGCGLITSIEKWHACTGSSASSRRALSSVLVFSA
jgi:hypothetical protein